MPYNTSQRPTILIIHKPPREWSFFHKNERNDQERIHCSKKKNKRIERVLKNDGTICKGTERKFLKERLKSETRSYYNEKCL